jgi:hypothetical protein
VIFRRGPSLQEHLSLRVEDEYGDRAMQESKLMSATFFLGPDLLVVFVYKHDTLGPRDAIIVTIASTRFYDLLAHT